MTYQVSDLVKDVRVAMDENRESDPLFDASDVDSLQTDDIIQSKLVEAVERVESMAPYYLLEEGHNFETDSDGEVPISWRGTDVCGWVTLPDDFMRMVVFEMSDWERPVYDVITTDDALYARQRGRVKGLRGTPQKPVVALAERTTGKVLEFYSCKSQSANVTQAVYIPHRSIENDAIDFSERCYKAVVYMSAGLASATMGDNDRSSAFMELCKTYLEK